MAITATLVLCKTCGDEVLVCGSRIRHDKTGNFYCSRSCYTKSKIKDKVEVKCAQCGKVKMVDAYRVKQNKTGRFFCHKECLSSWLKYNTGHINTIRFKQPEMLKLELMAELYEKVKNGGDRNEIQQEYKSKLATIGREI